jgi:hypothetical protein
MLDKLNEITPKNIGLPSTFNLMLDALKNDFSSSITGMRRYTVCSIETSSSTAKEFDYSDLSVLFEDLRNMDTASVYIEIVITGGTHKLSRESGVEAIDVDSSSLFAFMNSYVWIKSGFDQNVTEESHFSDVSKIIQETTVGSYNEIFMLTNTTMSIGNNIKIETKLSGIEFGFSLVGSTLFTACDFVNTKSKNGLCIYANAGSTTFHRGTFDGYYVCVVGYVSDVNLFGTTFKNSVISAGHDYMGKICILKPIDDTSDNGIYNVVNGERNVFTEGGLIYDPNTPGVITRASSGSSDSRPEMGTLPRPACYFDTDLGYAISWSGTDWVGFDGEIV